MKIHYYIFYTILYKEKHYLKTMILLLALKGVANQVRLK